MADTLVVFGTTYTGVTGIKAEDSGGNVLTYTRVVTSISAVFDSGGTAITESNTLEDLRQYLTVTGTFSGGGTATLTNYSLSGTLAVGVSTITVTYGALTTTFDVTVSRISYPAIYVLGNTPVTANADLYEDTGLTFGSSAANGVAKAWTILGDIETTAANTVVFDINSGTIQALALQIGGNANPLTYFCRNNCGAITGTNGRYRFAITHAAGVTNQVTYHIPSNGEVTTTAVSPSYSNLANAIYAGNLYLGGRTEASLVGTVNAFEIYEGIVDSTTIAEFLGVS